MKHEIEVQPWFNDHRRNAPAERHAEIKTVVRWSCSCGRIGPSRPLGLTMTSQRLAHRSARIGGAGHVRAAKSEDRP